VPDDSTDNSVAAALRQRYSAHELRRMYLRSQRIVAGLTVFLIVSWIVTSSRGLGVLEIITAVVTVGGTLLVTIQAIRRPTILPLRSLILQVIITGTVLVVNFAWIYWAYSPRPMTCMNVSLSKIDSAYFTPTTLTTVGYGDIAPVTERCRVIVSGQLILGAILIIIVLSLLVVRIVEAGTMRRS
jgi:hypothetical protein